MQQHFMWIAKFKDGSILKQIEDDQRKHDFRKHVLPKVDQLQSLFLVSVNGDSKRFGVNLETGDFLFDQGRLSDFGVRMGKHVDVEYPIEPPLRPILFRRVTKKMNLNKSTMITSYVYAIGWQATVEIPVCKDGKRWHPEKQNVKHILYIHPNGDLVFA